MWSVWSVFLEKIHLCQKREKEKVATPLMLSGWHHENEMNRDIGTNNSFPDFKEKQKPASTKHRLLKELMSNFGTVLRKTAMSRWNGIVLLIQSVDKLSKNEVLKDTNTKC